MAVQYTRPTARVGFAVYGIEPLIAEIRAHGIAVGDEIEHALALIAALDARRAAVVTPEARRNAAIVALHANPTADISAMVAAEVAAGTEANVVLNASDDARRVLVRIASTEADNLCRGVGLVLAAPAIETLTAAAKLPAHANAMQLLRDGKIAEAETLASVPTAVARFHAATRLRRALYRRSGIDELPCSAWRTPDALDRTALAQLDTDADRLVEGIRQGGGLWFGTYTEVDAASRAAADAAHPGRAVAVTGG